MMSGAASPGDNHPLHDPAGPSPVGPSGWAQPGIRRFVNTDFLTDKPPMSAAPYCGICQIRSAIRALGTGFQVRPGRVLTAAHLFLGMGAGEADTVEILFPDGVARRVVGATFRDTNRRQPGDPEDLVMLSAAASLPNELLRIGDPSMRLTPTLLIEVSGYPDPVPTQVRGRGPVLRDNGVWLDHAANTDHGHSGAPILANGPSGEPLVVGVQVVGGVGSEVGLPRLANRAIRLAPHLMAWIGG